MRRCTISSMRLHKEKFMPRLTSILGLILSSAFAAAGDWPQWLGPNRDGSSTEKVAPWKGPLKVLWRVPGGEGPRLPGGSRGPAVLPAQGKGPGVGKVTVPDSHPRTQTRR